MRISAICSASSCTESVGSVMVCLPFSVFTTILLGHRRITAFTRCFRYITLYLAHSLHFHSGTKPETFLPTPGLTKDQNSSNPLRKTMYKSAEKTFFRRYTAYNTSILTTEKSARALLSKNNTTVATPTAYSPAQKPIIAAKRARYWKTIDIFHSIFDMRFCLFRQACSRSSFVQITWSENILSVIV